MVDPCSDPREEVGNERSGEIVESGATGKVTRGGSHWSHFNLSFTRPRYSCFGQSLMSAQFAGSGPTLCPA